MSGSERGTDDLTGDPVSAVVSRAGLLGFGRGGGGLFPRRCGDVLECGGDGGLVQWGRGIGNGPGNSQIFQSLPFSLLFSQFSCQVGDLFKKMYDQTFGYRRQISGDSLDRYVHTSMFVASDVIRGLGDGRRLLVLRFVWVSF